MLTVYTTTWMGQQMVWSVGSAASDIRRSRVAVASASAVPRVAVPRRLCAPASDAASDGAEEIVLPNNLISERIYVATEGMAVGTQAGATGGIQERKDPAVCEIRNQK